MACACNQNKPKVEEKEYTVNFPDGTSKTVRGEHAAKVAVTIAGGGTYSVR